MDALLFIVVTGVVVAFFLSRARRRKTRTERFLSLVGGVIAVAAMVAIIVWSEIERWFEEHREPDTVGEMIRERRANGQVTVVANVLRGSAAIHSKRWQSTTIDPALDRKFAGSDRVTVFS